MSIHDYLALSHRRWLRRRLSAVAARLAVLEARQARALDLGA